VVAADAVAPAAIAPVELPIGALTAALGAPVFAWLLLRTP
jgi:iron complex transport system permease protein